MNRLTHHSKTRNFAISFLGAIFIFLFACAPAANAAQSVTLAWLPSANPAVTGFKIYYGATSRVYTNSIAVGNVTNATISGLDDGTTYYFAATTYDNAGHESSFSVEVIYFIPAVQIPPSITNTVPTNTIPVITNTLPTLTNTVPAITNTPPAITNTIPNITNTVPVITNTIPYITNTPPVITNTVPAITNAPPVITNTTPVITNTISVTDPSALPKLAPIANQLVQPSSALHSVVLTGLSGGKEGSRIINVGLSSSATDLVSDLAFQMGGSGTAGTLTFRTASNTLGSAIITVTVVNNQTANNTFSRNFTVIVRAANPVSNLRPPTFFRKPGNTATIVGKNVFLSATATGKGLLKYAWKFNGKPIPGATGSTLILKKVSTAQAGVYSVTVSSAFGSTNSLAAVTVYETPAAKLGEMTRAANGNFTFPVTGVPGYKYVVQATTDLTHWTSVQTNTSPFVFEDQQTNENEKRFFRAYYDPAL